MHDHRSGDLTTGGERHEDLIHAARNAAGSGSAGPGAGGPLIPGGESADLGSLGERFEVLELISGGGQGVVHRARQLSPNREVAIKLMQAGERANEQQRARFAREAELVSRLSHPNIIRVYESGVVDGRCYFAMEYVDGMSIDDYAMLNGSTAEQLIGMLVKVCRAISHAHQKGIIHRDIKPGNILVTKDGEPRVLDFGLAREAEGSRIVNAARAASMSGQVIGTTAYLSPEQAKGKSREADTRTDVYGLGVTLYYLLAQQFPYDIEGSPDEVRERIIKMPALPLRSALKSAGTHARPMTPGLAADVEAVLGKALEKDPELRYRSAADMADELERCLKGEPVAARSANRVYRLRKWVRRHRLGVTVGSVIAATIMAALVIVTVAWRRSERAMRVYRDGVTARQHFETAGIAREAQNPKLQREQLHNAIELIPLNTTTDAGLLALLADCNIRLATLDLAKEVVRVHGVDRAYGSLLEAESATDKIPATSPAGLSLRAKTLTLRATIAELGEQWAEAVELRKEAKRLRTAAARQGDDYRTLLDLAEDLRMSSYDLAKVGRMDEAESDLCAALDLANECYRQRPDTTDAIIVLAKALGEVAYLNMGHDTIESYELAELYLQEEDRLLMSAGEAGYLVTQMQTANRLLRSTRKNINFVKDKIRERVDMPER